MATAKAATGRSKSKKKTLLSKRKSYKMLSYVSYLMSASYRWTTSKKHKKCVHEETQPDFEAPKQTQRLARKVHERDA